MANSFTTAFLRPTSLERGLNRAFGALIGLGFGLRHSYLLQVRGRKSGRMYSTPVNLLEIDKKLYLVCPRGRAQWVRNAEASGRILLKKRRIQEFWLSAIPDKEKPAILKEYLDRFKLTVQRYFPVRAGSPPAAFTPYAARYPVFGLRPTGEQ
ncbi:MAG: nitroreductase family deazaflavin-dependent oxidoreductase [Deltaproteobacteria bacterium]|nr:nitroreductase family deazaflavin-dependent oxidoreductase [Deltaproteobacteria bacterium]